MKTRRLIRTTGAPRVLTGLFQIHLTAPHKTNIKNIIAMKSLIRNMQLCFLMAVTASAASAAEPASTPFLPTHEGGASMAWRPGPAAGAGGGNDTSTAGKSTPNPPPPSPVAMFTGDAYTVGTKRNATSSAREAEEHIAVAPGNPNALVAAISDYSSTRVVNGKTGHNTTKYAVSRDNGNSWRESFVPLDANGFPITSDGHSWEANSDPVVAIDASGNVYMADLYFNITDKANGLYVNVGDLSGAPFSAGFAVAANYDPAAPNFEDKPWIAVDTGGDSPYRGRVYVSWTRFGSTSDIYSSWSDDGAHWSAPLLLNPADQSGALQGSQLAVGPDGTVYAVWMASPYDSVTRQSQRRQFFAKSFDGGQTFSGAAAISPALNNVNFTSTYRKNSFPALAVDPRHGQQNVYVVYADQPNSTLGAEIEFIASINGGPFTSPVRINDSSAGQQFMPGLAVDDQGRVHCSWFDTRNSPDGTAAYFDIYATYSADSGQTFAPNARVTSSTISSDSGPWPPRLDQRFIGDYSGMAAGGGYAHPVWTDGLLQTATLLLPSVKDFSLVAAPGSASVAPGQDATLAVDVAGYGGFADPVDFSVEGLPFDAFWSLIPSTISGNGSASLTVRSSTPGNYELTVTGTSGSMVRSDTVHLGVEDPDFSLSVSPASTRVASKGGMATYTVDIARLGGFADMINLSISGAPLGVTPGFSPNPAATSATMTLTVAPGTAAGSYPLTITGSALSGASWTHSAMATLVVAATPIAVYVVRPSGVSGYSVSGGKNNTSNLSVQVALRDDFGDPVAGASVESTIYLGNSPYPSNTATTDAAGVANFILRNAAAGTYTTRVTRVTATALAWDGVTPANSYTKIK